jgi:DNA adenine methylase
MLKEMEDTPAKPILKWVGGKSQILDKILSVFPKKIQDYHEPFLGGGSVLIGLLSDTSIHVTGKIFAYDLNSELISLYKHVQKNPRKLIKETLLLSEEYNKTPKQGQVNRKCKTKEEAMSSPESYYFYIRTRFNTEKKNTIQSSAMLLFLNKTCFRGLYRVGPNGFNVPFGNYKNPTIIEPSNILKVSELVKNVEFIHCSFENCSFWKSYKPLDFIYLDPPYAPETNKSFVSYNKEGFDIENHKNLFNLVSNLKCKFLMSNSNVHLVTDTFKNDFIIETITCKRSINSKDPSKKTKEVLIYNRLL